MGMKNKTGLFRKILSSVAMLLYLTAAYGQGGFDNPTRAVYIFDRFTG
jgi:hypothetical protein